MKQGGSVRNDFGPKEPLLGWDQADMQVSSPGSFWQVPWEYHKPTTLRVPGERTLAWGIGRNSVKEWAFDLRLQRLSCFSKQRLEVG